MVDEADERESEEREKKNKKKLQDKRDSIHKEGGQKVIHIVKGIEKWWEESLTGTRGALIWAVAALRNLWAIPRAVFFRLADGE